MKDKVSYDPNSPSGLVWKITFGKVKAGDVAGTRRSDGYWRVGKSKAYVHRVIWEIFNNEISFGMLIDHIDGNPSNNRIENLRLVSHESNMRNSKLRADNKSGINGVAFEIINGFEYYSTVWYDKEGKQKVIRFSVLKLGKEKAIEEASILRYTIEKELGHFSDRHGKIQLGEFNESRRYCK